MGFTAAFAGVALAIPAFADISVSGFMNQRIGFGDYRGGKESDDSIHFRTDAEVLFTGTGTTDGGLKITARVELEGDSGGDQIDENWLSIEGDFGRVTLGGEDGAAITHGYVGIGSGFGNIGYYDSGDTWTPVGSEIYPIGYGDYQGIRFSTPNVGGFSGAVSFQPEAKDAGGSQTSTDNNHNIISVAGSYSTSVGTMSLTIGGGFLSRADNPDDRMFDATAVTSASDRRELAEEYFGKVPTRGLTDDEILDELESVNDDNSLGSHWGVGMSLGFGANTLHLRTDVRSDKNGEGKDQTDLGIQLERSVGGTTFGIGYSMRTDEGTVRTFKNGAVVPEDTEYSKIVVGANHVLGGGVTIGAGIAWGEIDRGAGPLVDAAGTAARTGADAVPDSPDGTAFGAHIAFSF